MSVSQRLTRLSPPSCILAVFALAFGAAAVPTQGQAQDAIKINSRWLGDRVLITWAWNYFQGTNMAVIVDDEGLVVIDTGLSPTAVRRQRDLIERELGRSDFRYLVNTHTDNDHVFANQVFPEATLVGPVEGVAALEQEVARIPELLERLRSSQERYREWAAVTSPDSAEGQHAREGVAAFALGIADLEAGIEPRVPTLTFEDRHTLRLGDATLELFTFTGLHSEADILILIPEERMLFTGDVFWGGQLPLLREGPPDEIPRLLHAWKSILASSPDLETIVPGHSDVPLTVEQFREMYDYLARLWGDVRAAREEGMPLRTFLMRNVFAERYPEVADYNFVRRDYNLHQHNIYILWQAAGLS